MLNSIQQSVRSFILFCTLARCRTASSFMRENKYKSPLRIITYLLECILGIFGQKPDYSLPCFSRTCVAMGVTYIKFGQLLSTRPDLVGEYIAKDLSTLQENVPVFSHNIAEEIVSKSLNDSIDKIFKYFSTPISGASLSQVHQAIDMHDTRLAVKVIRPTIRQQIHKDCGTLMWLANILCRMSSECYRCRLEDVVKEFQETLYTEADLRNEATEIELFKDIVCNNPDIIIPRPYHNLSSKNVLVTSWIDGIRVDDYDEIKRSNCNTLKMSEMILRTFFETTLHHGVFHADMHHGNIRITPENKLVLFDFGITGYLDLPTRRAYAEILHGIITGDYVMATQAHKRAGYIPIDTCEHKFAMALRTISKSILLNNRNNFSISHLLVKMFETTRIFGMQTQPQLILLQKTMLNVEGIARALNPSVNIYAVAKPVVQQWVKEHSGPCHIFVDICQKINNFDKVVARTDKILRDIENRQKRSDNITIKNKIYISIIIAIITLYILYKTS